MNWNSTAIKSNIDQFKLLYISIAAVTLLNVGLLYDLVKDWIRDDNYSHGFFIIPLSIYIIYKKKDELEFPAAKSTKGLVLFILGCLGLIVATAASEYFTSRISFIMMISGISMYFIGEANFKKLWFAFVFLIFMVPVPAIIYYAATLPMQLFATKATVFLLDTIGVPVARNGNIIMLPRYQLEVVEACSGLRSLVTLLALSSLYAYFYMKGKTVSTILFFSAIPIAIVANVFRIFVTAIAAYAISEELAENFLHDLSGFLVFFIALILIIIWSGILRLIQKRLTKSSPSTQ